ncbi:hypothetical protein FKM82_027291 [Ascaphus truei]
MIDADRAKSLQIPIKGKLSVLRLEQIAQPAVTVTTWRQIGNRALALPGQVAVTDFVLGSKSFLGLYWDIYILKYYIFFLPFTYYFQN